MIFADIEVVPAVHWDEDTRAYYASKSKTDDPDEAFRETALHPLRGRIWLIGLASTASREPTVLINEDPSCDGANARLMSQLDEMVFKARPPWVGWNCNEYDWPFLRAAAQKHNRLNLANAIPHDRWGKKNSIDLALWAKGSRRWIYSLDEYSRFLGLEGKTKGVDGTQVYDLYKAYLEGDETALERAVEYVKQDVRMLQTLWPVYAADTGK